GDGQGRCFAFYSFQRAVTDALRDKRQRANGNAAADPELAHLETLKDRIHAFLSATDVTFVCYASEVRVDGRLVGLGEEAEKRLYIESNALNSQATKEEVIKYESFSPVMVLLHEDRAEPENSWMDAEHIEEDSKVVGKSSPKLFTLSALTQAYSYSILGDTDPISNPNAEMFRKVAARAPFVRAYWRRISRAFGPLWVPPDSKRLAYLEERRQERNVAFQAVFLHALGRLGFALGESARWDAGAAVLDKLALFRTQSWKAYTGSDPEGRDVKAYDPAWALAMMKPRVNRETGAVDGYLFEHAGDKIRATEERLAAMLES
ncbi:MAG: DNA sulfur modification protein DndB, partial [Myxococcota bacterium]|nr:DNA sulfur modification protein DndB [Myxococcota bacterium]